MATKTQSPNGSDQTDFLRDFKLLHFGPTAFSCLRPVPITMSVPIAHVRFPDARNPANVFECVDRHFRNFTMVLFVFLIFYVLKNPFFFSFVFSFSLFFFLFFLFVLLFVFPFSFAFFMCTCFFHVYTISHFSPPPFFLLLFCFFLDTVGVLLHADSKNRCRTTTRVPNHTRVWPFVFTFSPSRFLSSADPACQRFRVQVLQDVFSDLHRQL